jgi:hypothetical protein
MASLGVLGLAVFLAWERWAASPMLPLTAFAQRQFAAVNAVSFLGSGLALLSLTVIMLVLSGRSWQLAARTGPRLQLSAGLW